MAPATANNDQTSLPLADYFFIAGIESSQIVDVEKLQANGLTTPKVEDTIEEHTVLETALNGRPRSSEGLNGVDQSQQRRTRLHYETRKSISSMLGSGSGSASNRSSATIRGVQFSESKGVQLVDQGGPVGGSGLSDEDFDSALRKFAFERENFLEEIQFSAG